MSQHRPVPRLDLAPKLKRPLSLWNPLDYLRLLYWVFFFPQALRWYLDTFGDGYVPPWKNWRQAWTLLYQNAIQRQFLLQGLVLTVVTSLALSVIFRVVQEIDVLHNWLRTALVFLWEVALLLASLVVWLFAFAWALVVALSLVSVVKPGATFSQQDYVGKKKASFRSPAAFWLWLLIGIPIFIAMLVSARPFLAAVFLAGFVRLRLENWLFGLLLMRLRLRSGHWLIPHVTPIPLLPISSALTTWLRQDWEKGLHNANQLLVYTFQFIPVVQAINHVLAETPPEQVIFRVVQLAEAPFNWQVVRFASASVYPMDFLLPVFWLASSEERKVRLDTPANAAAAGFWYLHRKEPTKAMEAFATVRSLPYGEEMFSIAQILAAFDEAQGLATIAADFCTSPKKPLLRPSTWKTFARLHRVFEDIQVVDRSVSRSARAFALNRALGELQDILKNADTLPQAEGELIVDIAQIWQKALLQVAGGVGEVSITEPVRNPYIVGDPVKGNLFVGREDVLRQLEEFWVMGHQLQSVVLYGHRRMGKTSILLNAANCSGSGVKVAYVNLLSLGDSPQGAGEVLMAISDAISDAVGCTPPDDADLLNLPYRTFERYLKQVEAQLNGGLIVALDEFEKIEELIEAGKIPKDFMGYLRGLVQMSSKVAFAFAGLHTLEEMTADYFQPFFASVIPIHVGFLQPGATRQILANPDEDFPLDYTPEALDQIYTLTAGQPYLVQLVGFQLVRRYNDFVFEQGRPRNPVFTVQDVEAVINDPEFFKRGRYYFDGVWGQAARGASGQQAILKALAPHPEGLSIDALAQVTGMEEETLQEALKTLKRHDVVQEREGGWQIIVELFRRWVLQS
jgi:hypothetical protein